MTTVEVTLPDELAAEARQAGLLSPEPLEMLLRERLRTQKVDELFFAMNRMSELETLALSPEEVSQELAAMRAEKRAADKR